jgi:hypothetical protein
MAAEFAICLAFTLKAEGGYVDNPADPGAATNLGITLATLRQWSDDPDLDRAQIEDMPLRTARAVCRSRYWNPLQGDALPEGVDLSVFDMGSMPASGDPRGCCNEPSASAAMRWTVAPVRRPSRRWQSASRAYSSMIWRSAKLHFIEDWRISRFLGRAGSIAPKRDGMLRSS